MSTRVVSTKTTDNMADPLSDKDSKSSASRSDVPLRYANVQRGLKSRHIQMISLAGMIGTGLFLSSGIALATAGPLGALLGYIIMGLVTASVAVTSGEMSAFMPVTGGFVRHTTLFVDRGLGVTVGWNFWYALAITQAVEVVAASSLVSFWAPNVNPAAWISIFWVVILVINLTPVRYYGEAEFFFAIIKISLVLGLLIVGLLIDVGAVPGQNRIGFRYWKHPGPFRQLEYAGGVIPGPKGRFLAFWTTLINAAFAYGNVQIVGIAGSETINPRVAIPKAISRTFSRIILFYVLTIFFIGLILSSDNPALTLSDGTAATAPFVIAIRAAGIKALPSIVNAVVMTSAFSSGVSCVFVASRTLLGLANDGAAHRFLLITNSFGTPYVAIILTWTLGGFAFLSVQYKALQVLLWLVNISAIAGLVSWVFLCVAYLRMYAGMKAQGYSRDELPYRSWYQPYNAWFGLISCTVIVLFSGFQVFLKGSFTASGFLSNYINVFLFAGFYILYKGFTRSKQLYIPAGRIDLSEFDTLRQERAEEAARLEGSEEDSSEKPDAPWGWLRKAGDMVF